MSKTSNIEVPSYVYDAKEVYLTGRIAKRDKKILVEIVPVGSALDDITYAKWVKMQDLMIISDAQDEEIEDPEED